VTRWRTHRPTSGKSLHKGPRSSQEPFSADRLRGEDDPLDFLHPLRNLARIQGLHPETPANFARCANRH
jgi:hypothetical protein